MLKDKVLALLKESGASLSGEEMSKALGVSRTAVWKAVELLREEGYVIRSAPRRGYRLEASPDVLSPGELGVALAGRRLGREVVCLERVDSTNSEAKRRAERGAPEGLVVLADGQTGGRGRQGRRFLSPSGKGLYLSVLLRPDCPLGELWQLTAWAAVAVCDAVEAVCHVRPGVKWPNDIILEGKKLCGILTELGMEAESGACQYVVVGIGLNISQTEEDFGADLAPLAVSLQQALGAAPRRGELAAAVLTALDTLYAVFPDGRERCLARYRAGCLTLGRQIRVLRASESRRAFAEELGEDFTLLVRYEDGERERLSSGEVSVRGLLG